MPRQNQLWENVCIGLKIPGYRRSLWASLGNGNLKQSHCSHSRGRKQWTETFVLVLGWLYLSHLVQGAAHEMVPPTFTVGLSNSMIYKKKISPTGRSTGQPDWNNSSQMPPIPGDAALCPDKLTKLQTGETKVFHVFVGHLHFIFWELSLQLLSPFIHWVHSLLFSFCEFFMYSNINPLSDT